VTLIVIFIALVGGQLLGFAHCKKWIAEAWQPLGVVTLPLLCAMWPPELSARACSLQPLWQAWESKWVSRKRAGTGGNSPRDGGN